MVWDGCSTKDRNDQNDQKENGTLIPLLKKRPSKKWRPYYIRLLLFVHSDFCDLVFLCFCVFEGSGASLVV